MFLAVIVEELAGFSAPKGLDEALQGCYTFLRGEWRARATHVGLDPAWIDKDTGDSTRREVNRGAATGLGSQFPLAWFRNVGLGLYFACAIV